MESPPKPPVQSEYFPATNAFLGLEPPKPPRTPSAPGLELLGPDDAAADPFSEPAPAEAPFATPPDPSSFSLPSFLTPSDGGGGEYLPATNAFFRGLFSSEPKPAAVDVDDLSRVSVKDLRASIAAAGLRHDDCLERKDLEARYRDALSRGGGGGAGDAASTFVDFEGLPCLFVGQTEAPDLVVVLYHGYGAGALELAPLAQLICERLGAHRLQVVLPQCPAGAWFELDFGQYLMAIVQGEDEKARVVRATPPDVPAMRRRQRLFLAAVRRRFGIEATQLCLAGFSQGAMVAVDVALDLEETVAGVVALSGFVMAVETWAARLAAAHRGLRVLQLHGLQDRTIPFYTASWLRDLLATNGARVTFIPHSGGHEFGPPHVLAALLSFLAALMPPM